MDVGRDFKQALRKTGGKNYSFNLISQNKKIFVES
jgi:hypothetical protein